MTIISYAQNNEDVILWRALKHIEKGFYIDVGANDPVSDSVTKLFYDKGWRGINIEPSKTYCEMLRNERPLDINLQCIAGEDDGSGLFFEAQTRGWSTSAQSIGQVYEEKGLATTKNVAAARLDTIILNYADKEIHFLKIDVEGAEASVLRGLTLTRYRPWILLIEVLDPITHKLNCDEWEPTVLDAGYEQVYFDGLNRYYLAKEHIDLKNAFLSPPNVLDEYLPHAVIYWKERAEHAEAVAEKSATELSMVLGSLSWKITKPIRFIQKIKNSFLN